MGLSLINLQLQTRQGLDTVSETSRGLFDDGGYNSEKDYDFRDKKMGTGEKWICRGATNSPERFTKLSLPENQNQNQKSVYHCCSFNNF